MEFWKIYRIIKARRWLILGLMLITLLTVFIAKKALDEQTQYVASATVLPSPAAMAGGFYTDSRKGGVMTSTTDRFMRQAQFLHEIKFAYGKAVYDVTQKSPTAQKQTVVQALLNNISLEDLKNKLHLPHNSSKDVTAVVSAAKEDSINQILKDQNIPTDTATWVQRSTSQAPEPANLSAMPVYDTAVNTTPGATTPTPVATDYLQIMLHAADPGVATQFANLVAAEFINSYKDQGLADYNANINNANKREADATRDYNSAYDNLIAFKRQTPYVELGTTETSYLNNMVALKRQRDVAETQLQVASREISSYQQLANTTPKSIVVTMDARARPHYQQLQEQIADAQMQLDALGNDLTPNNPRYQHAKQNLASLTRERDNFLKQPYINVTPNNQYQALLAQVTAARAEAARADQTIKSLDSQIASQESLNQTLPEKQRRLQTLQENLAEAEASKKSAAAAVQKLKENRTSFNAGLISLDSPAIAAIPDTSGPGLASLLIYGAILSLIFGIAAAIGLDYLDNSVQTIPDAEKLLGMPVSAVIPAMPPGDERRNTRLVVSDPLSPIAEAYRLLRTDLLFTAEEKPFQSLMAATAKPGQGATTTICNLAVALAAVGKRVILIDADLRRPKLHSFFNVPNEIGLTSLLRDECELEEALKVTDIDNLLVLPSGPLPLNPAELLASQKMRSLHERLKPHTDFVLVDTPSAIAFSDSSILASYLDAVMIVVRAQETPRGSEIQLKNLLNKARANVVGVVLNGVKPQLVDSYFYHAAYYPQITTGNGHALGVSSNGGVLPPPKGKNGYEGKQKTQERTLEGEGLGEVVTGHSSDASSQDIESTLVMDDVERDGENIVTVTPAKPRSRFSLRRKPGDDNRN